VAVIEGFVTRPATAAQLSSDLITQDVWRHWLYEVQWDLQAHPASSRANLAGQVWLICADDAGVGAALAEQLRAQHARPILLFAVADHHRNGTMGQASTRTDVYMLDPTAPHTYEQLLAALPPLDQVVHLWSLDVAAPPAAPLAGAQHGWGSALPLVQGLLNQATRLPALCLVTSGGQCVTATDRLAGLAQSPLWGMGKVIALEYPELACRRLDLDPAMRAVEAAAALLAELSVVATPTLREDQVALRAGQRYVARLAQLPSLLEPQQPAAFDLAERGTLDKIGWRPLTRTAPAADEVEIQVYAAGLNFRDLLNVLGLYPGDPGVPGLECSGIVTAVGEGVQAFQVGDAVVALGNGCFHQFVTLKTQQIVHKPAKLTFVEAATLPIAFLTAQLCMHHLAGMQPGERILIHAASGGVGMAAVQLAQAAGVQVFATASPGKWAALRALGVQHLYNSRDLTFAEGILRDTEGAGVHLVLNSLTGPGFIEKSLSLLAPGGRFVEIGKRDVWSAAQITAQRPDVRYFLVDLQQWFEQQPALLQRMLTHLVTQCADGLLKPLPQQLFPRERVGEAFRTMRQARHIGKLVITHPHTQPLAIRPDATYLITGGLGALGLQVAHWFGEQGARHLLLVGRRPPTAAAREQLAALAALDVAVTVVQADVTDGEQVAQLLAQIDTKRPLHGIVHAAGVLADGALINQSWEKFTQVLAPKVAGAWHLHHLTRAMPLDFFVCFSSLAGVVGKRGQAGYAAANAFLDALAHHRHAHGLPALTIAWGAWAAGGMATQAAAELQSLGLTPITPTQGLHLFGHLLRQPLPQVGVAPIHWASWLRQYQPAPPAFFSHFHNAHAPAAGPAAGPTLRSQLENASPRERRQRLLLCVQEAVMQILQLTHLPAPKQGFTAMGLDSLMAVKVRNRLQNQLDWYLPPALLFNYPTVDDLTAYLVEQLPAVTPAENAPPRSDFEQGPTNEHSLSLDAISLDAISLDDTDIDALIGEELQKLSRFL
jgi:myxalamid-type polyketide synthase MxaB